MLMDLLSIGVIRNLNLSQQKAIILDYIFLRILTVNVILSGTEIFFIQVQPQVNEYAIYLGILKSLQVPYITLF
jgi:hypothetical protein